MIVKRIDDATLDLVVQQLVQDIHEVHCDHGSQDIIVLRRPLSFAPLMARPWWIFWERHSLNHLLKCTMSTWLMEIQINKEILDKREAAGRAIHGFRHSFTNFRDSPDNVLRTTRQWMYNMTYIKHITIMLKIKRNLKQNRHPARAYMFQTKSTMTS